MVSADPPRLDTYWIHEQEWDSYEQLYEAFEWELPDRFNIAAYLCDRWVGDDRTALFYEHPDGTEERYSFGELQAAANRLANYWREAGIEAGDRVGINMPQKPAALVGHVAAWKLGAVSIPLTPLYGTEGLSFRLEDAGAKAIVVDGRNVETLREVADRLPALETIMTVDVAPAESDEVAFWEAIESLPETFETVDTGPADPAFIFYTSGTTGDPKGVVLAHQTLLTQLPWYTVGLCNMDLREDHRFWTPADWSWVVILTSLFPTLFFGKPVLAYARKSFEPDATVALIDKYDITHIYAAPTALRMLLENADLEPYTFEQFRGIGAGGEAVGPNLREEAADAFGVYIHESYGETETGGVVAASSTAFDVLREGKMGKALPGYDIEIVDQDDPPTPLDPGEIGLFAVRSEGEPVCFLEYWNKPEQTRAKVQDGWHVIDDLGSVDEAGYLAFHSRADDVIISSGYRIGPAEVEDTLDGHDAVAVSGVIGIPDEERGEIAKAFVVPAKGWSPSTELADELKAYVRDRLAMYEYPREIEFIDEMPETVSGKVRRTSLREREGLE